MKPNNSCINLRPPSSVSSSPMTAAKVDKNRRKSHDEKTRTSTNSVSLSLRSSSPSSGGTTSTSTIKQLLVPRPISSTDTTTADQTHPNNNSSNNDKLNVTNNVTSIGNEKHKRKSMSDVVIVQGNITTYSSIKNDLGKLNPSGEGPTVKSGASTTIPTNLMPSLTQTVTSTTNGSTGSRSGSIPNTVTAMPPQSTGTMTQDHLQPKSNISANLSSNSSLNSSSVKSTTSKSNDGASIEKKHKSTSRSRQKKFHRHFKQVAIDEEVINYFSCAFVSDILLQGYLYITKNYIAFYSNVFGYVTKLLIPITSVVRISKEKTVKIIPNAIAVATTDERHVFSSFLSRESAYQLMLRIWQNALPQSDIDVLTAYAQLRIGPCNLTDANVTNSSDAASDSKLCADKVAPIFAKMATPLKQSLQVVQQQRRNTNSGADLDISELDDDSSSAISGNEGLVHLLQNSQSTPPSTELVHPNSSNSNAINCDSQVSTKHESSPDFDFAKCKMETDSLTSTPKVTFAPREQNDQKKPKVDTATINILKFRIPRTIHIAYFGLSLVIILSLIAIFLFYRIVEMKNLRMLRSFNVDDLNANAPPNVELFAEILKWQKDMQSQRVHLTRNVLTNNLEQISQISDSLQTLSNLIHANEDSGELNDELSSIMGECSNLENCIMNQQAATP